MTGAELDPGAVDCGLAECVMTLKYDDRSLDLPSDRTLSGRAGRSSGLAGRGHGDADAPACARRRDAVLKQRLGRMCLFGLSRAAVLGPGVESFGKRAQGEGGNER